MENHRLTAVSLFGIEGIIAEELKRLGAQHVFAETGRVLFSGDDNMVARANIFSRFAERVLIDVASFNAETFNEVFERVSAIPWEDYIEKNDDFPVVGHSRDSKLYSVPSLQSVIKKAIVERLKKIYHIEWFNQTGPQKKIRFWIHKNRMTVSLDTTGEKLHKRGYRERGSVAPIRETLAAAMCDRIRVFPDTHFIDPFCGSGTILIEAALMATRTAPGLMRSFAGEKFNFMRSGVWEEERERARSLIVKNADFRAEGYDIDPSLIETTKQNAKLAGVDKYITARVGDIKDFKIPEGRFVLVTNPPYGNRLLDESEAEDLYRLMGERFERGFGRKYGIITSDEAFEDYFGREADQNRKLYNGMIKCRYYLYFKGD